MKELIEQSVPVAAARKLGRSQDTNCWVWYGELNRNGYGRVWVQGKRLMAHRVVYESTRGPIPDGMVLDHLCRNRRCCNPDHLEPVTVKENTLRGQAVLFRPEGETLQ